MAVTKAAVKTKITDSFTITTTGGETYRVQEHTKYETAKIAGETRETLGRKYFKTEDGRGVIRNPDDDTYSIPSLDLKLARRVKEQS